MKHWHLSRLGDLLDEPLANGRSVPDRPGGFPVLRLTSVKGQHIDLKEAKEGAWTAEQAAPFLVREGDFLIVRGNGSLHLVGRGGLVGDAADAVAYPDTLIRARPNRRLIDSRYLSLVWESPAIREQIESAARTTAGIYKVNQAHLRNITLPVPTLDEQRRIVDILEEHLSRLDAADGSLTAAQERLTSLRASVLDFVVDDGGDRCLLSELIDRVEAGRSFGSSSAPAAPDEWGIIKVSAMTWGEFRAHENKAVRAEAADPRYEIHAGDLLVSRANTSAYVGASVLVTKTRPRLLLSDKSLRLVPKPGVDRSWLQLVLSAPRARQQISDRATGTKESMRNISQVALLGIDVPHRTLNEQSAEAARCRAWMDGVDLMTTELAAAARRSSSLRRALLAAAFSGRLTGRSSDLDIAEELMPA